MYTLFLGVLYQGYDEKDERDTKAYITRSNQKVYYQQYKLHFVSFAHKKKKSPVSAPGSLNCTILTRAPEDTPALQHGEDLVHVERTVRHPPDTDRLDRRRAETIGHKR